MSTSEVVNCQLTCEVVLFAGSESSADLERAAITKLYDYILVPKGRNWFQRLMYGDDDSMRFLVVSAKHDPKRSEYMGGE